MVGLERVLHAEQKSKPQNSKHVCHLSLEPELHIGLKPAQPRFNSRCK
jgi:hypothetical protein